MVAHGDGKRLLLPDQYDDAYGKSGDTEQVQTELPRVYWRVKLSEDEPYGREEEDIALFA